MNRERNERKQLRAFIILGIKNHRSATVFNWHFRCCFLSLWFRKLKNYGGWFVPFRLIVFSGRKSVKAPRENPPNGDFFVFSHGDLSTRHTKVRQTEGEKATHAKCRTFVWRGERSLCENTKKSPFDPPHESTTLSMRRLFASCLSYLCLAGQKVATRKPAKITT